jgi:hypothetical protein
MGDLFAELPEACDNTLLIAESASARGPYGGDVTVWP